MGGAGVGGIYQDFTPFTSYEIDADFGILFINGLSLMSQYDMWFQLLDNRKIFGNNSFNKQFLDEARR